MYARDIRFAQPSAPRHQMVLYAQSLDDLVPAGDPVRLFNGLLDEVDWTPWEQAYAGCGQPPTHPRYLASAILYGLMNKVLSTRQLEMAARKHVDFIWLLEGFAPDHSTFANFRLRHEKDIGDLSKQIAKALVKKRRKPLLELLIDGTRMRADSDRHGARSAKTIEAIIRELEQRLKEMKRNDAPVVAPQTPYFEGMAPPEGEEEKLIWVEKEIAKLEAQREKHQKALNAAKERDESARKRHGKKAKPVRVPVTDPDSLIAPNKEGGFAPNYTPIAVTEPETGAIVYAGVPEGADEASTVMPAVEATEALLGEEAGAVLADGNFATGEVLAALDERGIDAYMPIRSASPPDNPALRPDPTQPVPEEGLSRLPKKGKEFDRAAFVYDEEADVYHCPSGHAMPPNCQRHRDGIRRTYYQCDACPDCPLAPQCLKGKAKFRNVVRDEYEPLREAAAQRMGTEEGQATYKKRAPGIEGVFARIKAGMGIRRFARRGLGKVRVDWTWICTAYNLKKLLARQARSGPEPGGYTAGPPTDQACGPISRIFTAIYRCFQNIRGHSPYPMPGANLSDNFMSLSGVE